jgi:hypothetical protein
VRHVRMLGLCLVAVFATSAVAATSALATKEGTTNTAVFKNCPATNPEAVKCSFAATTPGEGGYFRVGGITVPITKQIKLQGAITEEGEGVIGGGTARIIPPEDGASPIVPVAETVPGEVFGNISEAEMNEFGWPQSLRESYKTAQKRHWFHEGKTTEVIEPAGLNPDYLSEFDLLVGGGTAIRANVRIQGKNKWLESVGGNCFIGSEADPVVQNLTTGESTSPLTGETVYGKPGYPLVIHNFEEATVTGDQLVDNTYAVPGAEGCGGSANEAYLDPAIDRAFGVPAAAGASVTVLSGSVYVMTTYSARKRGY